MLCNAQKTTPLARKAKTHTFFCHKLSPLPPFGLRGKKIKLKTLYLILRVRVYFEIKD